MRVIEGEHRVELTRSNLIALLVKLDGHPPESACTIKQDGWYVRAVENVEHYADRARGRMVGETEVGITNSPWQERTPLTRVMG
jgi:hypothetical protein